MNLKYDFHIHSCLSPCADNDMTPGNIAGMAFINELQAVALTDHNTCKNCEAFLEALKPYGIFGICGMELTTAEEVHVVCLFPSLTDAMDFDAYVSERQIQIPNRTDIFGNQLLYAPGDELKGEYESLLISATDITFSEVPACVSRFHGIHIPAHLERPSDSLISNLGFIPQDAQFKLFEINHPDQAKDIIDSHPYLARKPWLTDSDAHQLHVIKDSSSPYTIDVAELSFEGIFGPYL